MVLGSIKTEDIFKELIYRGEHGEKFDPGVIQRLMAFTATKPEDDDITKRVKKAIGCALAMDNEIRLEDNLVKDFAMDSLDEIDVIINLEREFEIELPDEYIIDCLGNKRNLVTVGDVAKMIKNKVN